MSEGMLAIATGHVAILSLAFIIYMVVRARRISAEKRLDALVQISRITGDAVGSEEIRHALGADVDLQRLSRWGTVLAVFAIGPIAVGLFSDMPWLLQGGLVIEMLGWGMIIGGKRYPGDQCVTDSA
ncbi:MAG: hypothetical protein ISR31_05390 [Luminiphilus sp.]|jgi:hypothetical protein|nr:hypothetical protein [Pseudomonadales bacterium]MBL6823765.1 hypothetical protein [Luminiphilus sp.]MBL6901640.1 hypothetical protein [Luminiphilus sp.]HCJ39792.1 hypothetical protein [Halieaceae bacterium]|tara:strand:+ start:250 stop:630 length:381 start_codon:yes stop_codon:yes gene_type:complete